MASISSGHLDIPKTPIPSIFQQLQFPTISQHLRLRSDNHNSDRHSLDKVLAFIEEVIGQPTYVAGNSLGGFIGTNLAANHPHSVLGLALMNATPFWAFRKPTSKGDNFSVRTGSDNDGTSSAAAGASVAEKGGVSGGTVMGFPETGEGGVPRGVTMDVSVPEEEGVPGGVMMGGSVTREEGVSGEGGGDWLKWDGILPAPEGLFRFGAWYFDRMRDPRTVKSMLGAVYSTPGKNHGGGGGRCLNVFFCVCMYRTSGRDSGY